MATLPQDIFKLSGLASRILEEIRMLSVLPKYMDNLFSSNHPRIAFSSLLSVFCMTAGFLPLTRRVESSAYSVTNCLLLLMQRSMQNIVVDKRSPQSPGLILDMLNICLRRALVVTYRKRRNRRR